MKYIEKNFDKIGIIILFYLIIIGMAILTNKRFQELNNEEISNKIVLANE